MITVIVRTLNEEHRIGQFCTSYATADKILVADGGSTDKTVEIAKTFPNVEVKNFNKRVNLKAGYWRNPDPEHTDFLIAWAKEYNPDWIISDDCDIRPNHLLKSEYIKILNETSCDVVLAVRVYLWGLEEYFPALSSPMGEPLGQGSLWAWRGHLDLWTVDHFPHFSFRLGDKKITDFKKDMNTLELLFPYCLLHYSWQTPEMADKKVKYHRESGTFDMVHPLKFGGGRKPLEDFMHE